MKDEKNICKVCHNELKEGYLYSGHSIDWYNKDDSFLKKNTSNGKKS